MTPDVIYDQMVAADVASKLVFSYMGNPGVGPLHAIRRAVEHGVPAPLEIEDSALRHGWALYGWSHASAVLSVAQLPRLRSAAGQRAHQVGGDPTVMDVSRWCRRSILT